MARKILVVMFLAWIVFACFSCGGTVPGTEGGVYSRYNLHYVSAKGRNKGSYANWTNLYGHAFSPYNTKIHVKSLGAKKFEFITDSGEVIIWEFNPANMEMSGNDYIKLITSPTPVNYEGLSDIDRQGIEAGKAMQGMSKQGVMIALGYPAKHRTPSTDLNTWYYWKGRFNMLTVIFNEEGKVVSLR